MVKSSKHIIEITHSMTNQNEQLQKIRQEKEYQIKQLKNAEHEFQALLKKKKLMIEDIKNTNISINKFYEKFEDIQNQKLDLQD
jgi:predicted  nucleic acid-binding Zn-ribbon protein